MKVYNKFIIIILLVTATVFNACDRKKSSSPGHTDVTPSLTQKDESITPQGIDKSPMDMSYYPVDYPILKMTEKIKDSPVARVIYSRPKKDGRIIFGELVKYGSRWRLGANEATEIEFFRSVMINSKIISKGRYVLYCIPFPDKWRLILNTDLFTWGLKIDSTKDLYSFEIPVIRSEHAAEIFTMEFMPSEKGMDLVMAWDHVKVILPVSYQKI